MKNSKSKKVKIGHTKIKQFPKLKVLNGCKHPSNCNK